MNYKTLSLIVSAAIAACCIGASSLADSGTYTFKQKIPALAVQSPLTAGELLMSESTGLTFSSITAGTSASLSVLLTNAGQQALTLSALSASAAPFTYTTSCGTSLAAAATCSISVLFAPTAAGSFNQTLSFTADGQSKSLALSGVATAAAVAVTDFGAYKGYSDGTYASSCKNYLNPTAPYTNTGATSSGTYRINRLGNAYDVYCDMTTDGGGWTLVAKNSQSGGARRDDVFTVNQSVLVGTVASNATSGFGRLPYAVIDDMFHESGVFQYRANGSVYLYYKRLTNPSTFAFTNGFMNWTQALNGDLNVDFKLYSTYSDLNSDANGWSACNYHPIVTFPRDCGRYGLVGNMWFAAADNYPFTGSTQVWIK